MLISLGAESENKLNIEKNFSDRVEGLISSYGVSKSWLAQKLGISRQAFNMILKRGKSPKYCSEIASIFDVSPAWLAYGKGEKKVSVNADDIAFLQVINIDSCFDSLMITPKKINGTIPIFEKGENLFAIQLCQYDAMEPEFQDNSILIFKKNVMPEENDYVIIDTGTLSEPNLIFRKYQIINDTAKLIASNKSYDDINFNSMNHRVFAVLHEYRRGFSKK